MQRTAYVIAQKEGYTAITDYLSEFSTALRSQSLFSRSGAKHVAAEAQAVSDNLLKWNK
jgi:hypothetical protein